MSLLACGCTDYPCYPAVKHPERCKLFWCSGCRAYRPWCQGANDEHPELCDAQASPLLRTEAA